MLTDEQIAGIIHCLDCGDSADESDVRALIDGIALLRKDNDRMNRLLQQCRSLCERCGGRGKCDHVPYKGTPNHPDGRCGLCDGDGYLDCLNKSNYSRDKMLAKIKDLDTHNYELQSLLAVHDETIKVREARIAELEAALKPFADYTEPFADACDDTRIGIYFPPSPVVGDLRRAADVLRKGKQ